MASEEEEQEQELEYAEAAFRDEEQPEDERIIAPGAERNQQILTALGFTPHYHDKDPEGNDETNFGIRVMNMKIGVKFNDKNPAGKVWAYVLTEDNKKDFIKNGNLKELPLVQRYLDIQAGKKPIPEATVTGRIVEKRSKSVVVEIEEDGEKKEVIFGLGALKRHDDGSHFIPLGFSKPSQDNPDGKMYVPRDILLPGLDPQPESREEAEAQRIREEQGRAPKLTTIPIPKADAAPAAKPMQAELITKYVELLAQVIVAVNAEDRIPKLEKGFGNKFVYYSVKHALENGNKGGDHEEA